MHKKLIGLNLVVHSRCVASFNCFWCSQESILGWVGSSLAQLDRAQLRLGSKLAEHKQCRLELLVGCNYLAWRSAQYYYYYYYFCLKFPKSALQSELKILDFCIAFKQYEFE